MEEEIFKPIFLFMMIVVISAIIVFFRFTNFFPFLSSSIYELKTNTIGVTAGGAIMSAVFFALNYISAIIFLIILLNVFQKRGEALRALNVLFISTFISLLIGLLQYFKKNGTGINPKIIGVGILDSKIISYVNSTFKDSLSFGTFLVIVFPVVLGIFLKTKNSILKKIFLSFVLILTLIEILFTGSRSGLWCLLISLFAFLVISLVSSLKLLRKRVFSPKNIISFTIIVILSIGILHLFNMTKSQEINKRFKVFPTLWRLNDTSQSGKNILSSIWTSRQPLWKPALLMLKDYPISGVGIGAFIIEVANYADKYNIKILAPESAENYFLQVGAELGIIGFIAITWVFWVIIKKLKSSYSLMLKSKKIDFISIGLISGIIAYLINIQVHTFIGSYEIKYTFWLLVGLLFILGRKEEEKEEAKESKDRSRDGKKHKLSKNYKLVGGALLLLFGVSHLWNSTHSLSLAHRSKVFGIKQDFGFYQLEKTVDGREFRWTRGYGGTTIKVDKPVIEISILASHPDIQRRPVKVRIYLVKDFFKKKKLLDEVILNRSIWHEYKYHLSGEVGEEVILLFKVNRTWIPLKVLGTPDPRKLGVAVEKIRCRDFQKQEKSL